MSEPTRKGAVPSPKSRLTALRGIGKPTSIVKVTESGAIPLPGEARSVTGGNPASAGTVTEATAVAVPPHGFVATTVKVWVSPGINATSGATQLVPTTCATTPLTTMPTSPPPASTVPRARTRLVLTIAPFDGISIRMVGGGTIVKGPAETADPIGVVTTIGPVVAAGGTLAVTWLPE